MRYPGEAGIACLPRLRGMRRDFVIGEKAAKDRFSFPYFLSVSDVHMPARVSGKGGLI